MFLLAHSSHIGGSFRAESKALGLSDSSESSVAFGEPLGFKGPLFALLLGGGFTESLGSEGGRLGGGRLVAVGLELSEASWAGRGAKSGSESGEALRTLLLGEGGGLLTGVGTVGGFASSEGSVQVEVASLELVLGGLAEEREPGHKVGDGGLDISLGCRDLLEGSLLDVLVSELQSKKACGLVDGLGADDAD